MSSFTIPVDLYMKAPVHTARTSDTLQLANERMNSLAISSLAITDREDRLAGVLSRTDLLRVGRYLAGTRPKAELLVLPNQPIEEVMTRDVVTVTPDETVEQACNLMVRRQVHRIFVVADGLAGVFGTRDAMEAVRDKRLNKPIEALMSRPLFTVRASEPISLATERLEKARITGLVVVEDDWPVGVFTQVEALQSRAMTRDTRIDEVMNPAILCMPLDTRAFRAAEQALAMNVRRIIACDKREMVGIVSGIDFVRAAA